MYYEIYCGLTLLPTLFKLCQGNFESAIVLDIEMVIVLLIQLYVLLCIDSLRNKIADVKENYAIPDYA